MQKPTDPKFTPEQTVLLWAIRPDHTLDQRVSGIIAAGIDWGYLRKTAVLHGIIPLLYWKLKGDMAEIVPPDELLTLKKLFRENAIRNIRMTHHLFKILDYLATSGVEAIPFKGPALAIQAYMDLSMRSFRDLDILIHPNDIDRVYWLLTKQKCSLKYPNQMTIERKLGFLDQKTIQLTSDGDLLEIHWKIIENLYAVPLNTELLWDRSQPIFIDGRTLTTLAPEDTVIILCFHGFKHGWQSLGWLADLIVMISNHPDLSWQDIFVRAESLGLKRIVLTGLFLAHKYGGITCRFESENQFASDIATRKLVQDIQLNLFQSWTLAIGPWLYLRSRERTKDKILFIVYHIINKALVLLRWLIRPFTEIRSKPFENRIR